MVDIKKISKRTLTRENYQEVRATLTPEEFRTSSYMYRIQKGESNPCTKCAKLIGITRSIEKFEKSYDIYNKMCECNCKVSLRKIGITV